MGLGHWVRYVLIPWYTSLGFTRRTVTLEVVGRKSGKTRRVSLSRTDWAGRSYFVSLAGESSWVQNVRAAGGKAILISGKRIPIRLKEIKPEESAPILLAYVQTRAFTHSGSQSARHFFGLGFHPNLEDMEAIVDRFVVFEILTMEGI